MKFFVVLACLATLGCGDDDSPDSGWMDVGTSDVFGGDDAEVDASADGALPDVGDETDASAARDASERDASPTDTGAADGSVADAGVDGGPDGGAMDAGSGSGPVDAGPPITCQVTGCSGQLCADMPTASTCEFAPWYICYPDAECEAQADGSCAWTPTPSFTACLEENGAPD